MSDTNYDNVEVYRSELWGMWKIGFWNVRDFDEIKNISMYFYVIS